MSVTKRFFVYGSIVIVVLALLLWLCGGKWFEAKAPPPPPESESVPAKPPVQKKTTPAPVAVTAVAKNVQPQPKAKKVVPITHVPDEHGGYTRVAQKPVVTPTPVPTSTPTPVPTPAPVVARAENVPPSNVICSKPGKWMWDLQAKAWECVLPPQEVAQPVLQPTPVPAMQQVMQPACQCYRDAQGRLMCSDSCSNSGAQASSDWSTGKVVAMGVVAAVAGYLLGHRGRSHRGGSSSTPPPAQQPQDPAPPGGPVDPAPRRW